MRAVSKLRTQLWLQTVWGRLVHSFIQEAEAMRPDSGERLDSLPKEASQKGGLLGRTWVGMQIITCIFSPTK